ncbi:hypothetical protein KKC16_03040 [Patescibacteria group bacterium]|nr:hypothetical protein [Patescibacteria group bacterium]
MFDFKNKIKSQPKIEDNSEILSQTDPPANANWRAGVKEILTDKQDKIKVDLNKVEVHSMPEKFLGNEDKKNVSAIGKAGKKKISGLQKNILIGILIGVLVVGLLGLAAFLFLKSIESPQNKQSVIEQPKSAQQVPDVEKPEFEEIQEPEYKKEQEFSEFNEDLEEELSEDDFLEQEPVLLPALDSDGDLLTDVEEELWETDASNKDTDGDSYLDGEEILNLYNPNSDQGGKLIDADLIQTYVNANFGYSIIYPSKWKLTEDELGEQVIFTSTTGEFAQVIVQENYGGFLSAKDWYLNQNPAVSVEDLEEVLIGNWSGARSPDKLNVYLINNNYIYIIAMNVGLKNELNYSTTLEMMLNNFKLFENPL